jgi:putative pyruvate formate lyase activating enzyme
VESTRSLLRECTICPRRCGVNRLAGELGYCRAGGEITVAHFGLHFGEEPPISGESGSGNIFFSSCNLHCLFCQNYQISQGGQGNAVSLEGLIDIFFRLEDAGCHNINLVTPTPYIPLLAEAIRAARGRGLGVPFVYNTNAYETVAALRTLEGLIDVYLPDFKYSSQAMAVRLSGAARKASYPDNAKAAILEMYRQVGHLVIEEGIARRGLLIRHLVLPGGLAGTRGVLSWIEEALGRECYISLMAQYEPLHTAGNYPALRRRITRREYDGVVRFLLDAGFHNGFIQELDSAPLFVPDFQKVNNPFAAKAGEGTKGGTAWKRR